MPFDSTHAAPWIVQPTREIDDFRETERVGQPLEPGSVLPITDDREGGLHAVTTQTPDRLDRDIDPLEGNQPRDAEQSISASDADPAMGRKSSSSIELSIWISTRLPKGDRMPSPRRPAEKECLRRKQDFRGSGVPTHPPVESSAEEPHRRHRRDHEQHRRSATQFRSQQGGQGREHRGKHKHDVRISHGGPERLEVSGEQKEEMPLGPCRRNEDETSITLPRLIHLFDHRATECPRNVEVPLETSEYPEPPCRYARIGDIDPDVRHDQQPVLATRFTPVGHGRPNYHWVLSGEPKDRSPVRTSSTLLLYLGA